MGNNVRYNAKYSVKKDTGSLIYRIQDTGYRSYRIKNVDAEDRMCNSGYMVYDIQNTIYRIQDT